MNLMKVFKDLSWVVPTSSSVLSQLFFPMRLPFLVLIDFVHNPTDSSASTEFLNYTAIRRYTQNTTGMGNYLVWSLPGLVGSLRRFELSNIHPSMDDVCAERKKTRALDLRITKECCPSQHLFAMIPYLWMLRDMIVSVSLFTKNAKRNAVVLQSPILRVLQTNDEEDSTLNTHLTHT